MSRLGLILRACFSVHFRLSINQSDRLKQGTVVLSYNNACILLLHKLHYISVDRLFEERMCFPPQRTHTTGWAPHLCMVHRTGLIFSFGSGRIFGPDLPWWLVIIPAYLSQELSTCHILRLLSWRICVHGLRFRLLGHPCLQFWGGGPFTVFSQKTLSQSEYL